jgi:flagellar export protein FliJ
VQRFQFRLQRVLAWQQRVCRTEEDKLRLCLAAVAETENKLAYLATEAVTIEQEFSIQAAMSPVDLRALAAFRRNAVVIRQKLEREQGARVAAAEAQRQALLHERRRLQILEKLRDRAFAEHTRAADREAEALSLESYLSTWVSATRR